jgi:transcriptional regulator of NAD metabolism
MSGKHAKGIVDAVKQSDVYGEATASLQDKDRATVEAAVEGFAEMLAPLVATLEELESSEEVMAAVRARLGEKLRGG